MSINISLHAEEILCELKGTYETTYSIPSRNYLQDIGDALKNFTAGPYTPFLVDKAKANFSDKWDKEEFFVNQYWNKDEITGELTLVDYEVLQLFRLYSNTDLQKIPLYPTYLKN